MSAAFCLIATFFSLVTLGREHARLKLDAEDGECLGPQLADRLVRLLVLEVLGDTLDRLALRLDANL